MGVPKMTDSNDANPYCSPLAVGVAIASPQRRFPSNAARAVAAVLLFVYGGLAMAFGSTGSFMLLGGCSVHIGDRCASDAQMWLVLCQMALVSAHGCFAIAVGRNVWKRRWKRSVCYLAGALSMVLVIAMMNCIVHQLPPGPPILWSPRSNAEATDNAPPPSP
jgi:hypothetical protein